MRKLALLRIKIEKVNEKDYDLPVIVFSVYESLFDEKYVVNGEDYNLYLGDDVDAVEEAVWLRVHAAITLVVERLTGIEDPAVIWDLDKEGHEIYVYDAEDSELDMTINADKEEAERYIRLLAWLAKAKHETGEELAAIRREDFGIVFLGFKNEVMFWRV